MNLITIKIARKLALLASASAFAILTGCGGGGGYSPPVVDQTMGTLKVEMTDAPACGFDEVNVTVSKVRVNQSATASETESGWVDITLSPARKINLVTLSNGVMTNLGQTTLAVGHYNQIRLVLAANDSTTPMANSVKVTGGVETALSTPSGQESGLKLNGQFDVAANTITDITLDFDACKSIVSRGSTGLYNLKPVITMVPLVLSGSIKGAIDVASAASNAVVTAQINGVVMKSTVPAADGTFTLTPLMQSSTAGNYNVVVTADGHATDVIAAVPVTAGADTTVSTAASPLLLSASASNTVSGVVLPIIAAGSVRTTQTFAAGPTVTIKYRSADAVTGAYSFTLATGAPMLGTFGTLPLTLTAQSAVAAKYTVEASATGYATQSAAADITILAVISNFTLIP